MLQAPQAPHVFHCSASPLTWLGNRRLAQHLAFMTTVVDGGDVMDENVRRRTFVFQISMCYQGALVDQKSSTNRFILPGCKMALNLCRNASVMFWPSVSRVNRSSMQQSMQKRKKKYFLNLVFTSFPSFCWLHSKLVFLPVVHHCAYTAQCIFPGSDERGLHSVFIWQQQGSSESCNLQAFLIDVINGLMDSPNVVEEIDEFSTIMR